MFENEIIERAEQLLGRTIRQEELASLRAMCSAASSELVGRLKGDANPEEFRELFVSAAGVLALSLYMQLGSSEPAGSFTAGKVSVSVSGSEDTRISAATLRQLAESMLGSYLKDNGFSFRGVRG